MVLLFTQKYLVQTHATQDTSYGFKRCSKLIGRSPNEAIGPFGDVEPALQNMCPLKKKHPQEDADKDIFMCKPGGCRLSVSSG